MTSSLPFYQDKLHEETVFRRFTEILAKARANKASNKPETELQEFERVRFYLSFSTLKLMMRFSDPQRAPSKGY